MGIIKVNEDAFLKLSKRKKILEEGKGHFTGYPSIDMPWLKHYTEEQILAPIPYDLTAYDYMRLLNSNNLLLPAIEFMGEQISYKDLFKKINDVTKSLDAIGVKPGDVVTIVLPPCPEETFLFYAIDQIGACANYVFFGTPVKEIEEEIEKFDSKHIFIQSEILSQSLKIQQDKELTVVQRQSGDNILSGCNTLSWDSFVEKSDDRIMPIYKRDPNSPVFIAKTGGSTGKPKSVLLSDNDFNLEVNQHLNSPLDYNAGDRWVRVWPLFSASSAVASSHLPLCFGMNTIIEPNVDIDKLDELILNYKPSHMLMISSCMESLIKSEKMKNTDLSFIKTMGIGGEGVTAEFEEKAENFLKEHNINSAMTYGYGMTENSSGATSRFNKDTSAIGSVGVPLINTIIGIFDPETGEELKYNEEGEICILSSTHMLGYFEQEELTKSVLREHKDGNIWLHSGDIGSMDENGLLYVKGRTKRMIMLFSGNKIYPLDLEEKIERIEEVDRVVIVPGPDSCHENAVIPCACITLNKDIPLSELKDKIKEALKENVANYVNVDNVFVFDSLPHTSIGKVDLQDLEQKVFKLCKRNN